VRDGTKIHRVLVNGPQSITCTTNSTQSLQRQTQSCARRQNASCTTTTELLLSTSTYIWSTSPGTPSMSCVRPHQGEQGRAILNFVRTPIRATRPAPCTSKVRLCAFDFRMVGGNPRPLPVLGPVRTQPACRLCALDCNRAQRARVFLFVDAGITGRHNRPKTTVNLGQPRVSPAVRMTGP
jgi:hypothetical protein